jgi:hypothetical protein
VRQCFRYIGDVRRPISYFWALHADLSIPLSDAASDGLGYARQLADDAKLRVEQLLSHDQRFPALTIQELAEVSGVPAATVRRRITLARKELFGELTDSGIRHRLRRKRQLRQQPRRSCQQPGCDNKLPWHSSAARLYCDQHRTPKARTARHRLGAQRHQL